MPNKHAALKQIRKDRKRHARNQSQLSELKTVTRQLADLLRTNKQEEARLVMRRVASRFDRAAAKGLVHRNTAARYKSRLTRRANQPASA